MTLLVQQKTYDYKISRGGTYLGLLQNVVSDFGYQQQIKTAGAQMTIKVGVTADTADQPVLEITDQDGNPITTEDEQTLTTERVPDVVGDGNEDNLIRNDNDVEVIEYSSYHPNGITVFKGYIAKWKAVFGGTDDIELTIISNGQDTTQYLVESGDVVYISQLTHSSERAMNYDDKGGFIDYIVQTFTMTATKTIDAISCMVTTTESNTLSCSVRHMTGAEPSPYADPVVAGGSITVGVVTQSEQKIVFNESTEMASGNVYYMQLSWGGTTDCNVRQITPSAYSGGSVYTYQWTGTSYSATTSYSTYDLYFKVWEYGGSTVATYTSQDPTFMLTDIIDEYQSRGGAIQKPLTAVTALVDQPINSVTLPVAYWSLAYAQRFTPTANMTINILQVSANISSGSQSMTCLIYQGDPTGDLVTVTGGNGTWDNAGGATLVGTSDSITVSNTTQKTLSMEFSTPVSLTGGTDYFLYFFWNQGEMGNQLMFGAGTGATLSDVQVGNLHLARCTINNASFGLDADSAYPAMFFKLIYELPIPDNLVDGYNDTGLSVTYTFQQQTILEAIGVIAGLSPPTWYWYVDVADDTLYFQNIASTAQHYIIKGRHIDELSIEATKERIANVVYFTGGPVAGVNIFVKTTDATSLASNRVGLVKLSDNRVITATNGTLISQNYIDTHNAEEYIATVVVSDSAYDISTYKLGETVQFTGFGTFMDDMLLQIVGVSRGVHSVSLDVGVLPRRSSDQVEKLERDLSLQQTLDNPDVPT